MRFFYNISPQRQRALHQLIPGIQALHFEETARWSEYNSGYRSFAISIFDHWLNESDSDAFLNQVPVDEQQRRDAKHRKFLDILFDETEVLTYRIKGKNKDRPVFKTFASRLAYHCKTWEFMGDFSPAPIHCAPKREVGRGWHNVVLPEFKAVHCRAFDDTNIINIHGEGIPEKILNWITECDLYILD